MFPRAVVLGALLTASACVTSAPGSTQTRASNPLVTIGAGQAEIGGARYWHVWYVIDRRTRTCWMKLGDAGAQLDCCALHRVTEAQPYLTWAHCPDEASPSPAITPGTAPGATPSAASPDAH